MKELVQFFGGFIELKPVDQVFFILVFVSLNAVISELQHLSNTKTSYKTNIKTVNAAPSGGPPQMTQTQEAGDNNFLISLLSLVCGTLCKNNPTVTEIIAGPTQNSTLNSEPIELQFQSEGFSKDTCRSMVAMLDEDKSGRLGFQEFKNLWTALRHWEKVWTMYDTDKSGTFSGFELREALNSAGYRLNYHVLNILMHRYGNKQGEIHFDDFMMCAIKLKTMIDIFQKKDETGTDTATFSMEEWLESTLYS